VGEPIKVKMVHTDIATDDPQKVCCEKAFFRLQLIGAQLVLKRLHFRISPALAATAVREPTHERNDSNMNADHQEEVADVVSTSAMVIHVEREPRWLKPFWFKLFWFTDATEKPLTL